MFEFHKDNEYFTMEQLYSYATKELLLFKASKQTLYRIVHSML
jgi:hypothetical protein